jgi:hypothetical protein
MVPLTTCKGELIEEKEAAACEGELIEDKKLVFLTRKV